MGENFLSGLLRENKGVKKVLKLGLLGMSLKHSFSKSIFDCLGMEYINFSVKPEEVKEFFRFALDRLDGFNITVPYKLKPFEFPDLFEFSDEAKVIGAVNTVLVKDGKLHAFNTDHIGFITPIKGRQFRKALLFGAGGAARAVIYSLKSIPVFVYNRTHRKAFELSRLFPNVVPVRDPGEILENVDIVVNATSLGLEGEPFYLLDRWRGSSFRGKLFYDLIYNPPITDFLKIGRDGGADILNGFPMLVFQATENIKIWMEKDLTKEVIECSKSLLPASLMEGFSWEF